MLRGCAVSAEPAARRYMAGDTSTTRLIRLPLTAIATSTIMPTQRLRRRLVRPVGQRMPPGAIVVKDSFTASERGRLWPGALFIMEKLADAASPQAAGWRYVMDHAGTAAPSATRRSMPLKWRSATPVMLPGASDDYLFFVPKVQQRCQRPQALHRAGPLSNQGRSVCRPNKPDRSCPLSQRLLPHAAGGPRGLRLHHTLIRAGFSDLRGCVGTTFRNHLRRAEDASGGGFACR